MQGTIKMFDPATNEGIVVRDTDREDFVLAVNEVATNSVATNAGSVRMKPPMNRMSPRA